MSSDDPDVFDPDPAWADQDDADTADEYADELIEGEEAGVFERARLVDEVGSAAIEGEVIPAASKVHEAVSAAIDAMLRDLFDEQRRRWADQQAERQPQALPARLGDGWRPVGYTFDGDRFTEVFVARIGTPEPLDLGDVLSMPGRLFGSPAPARPHVDLIGARIGCTGNGLPALPPFWTSSRSTQGECDSDERHVGPAGP